jgi:aminoglycoside 6'-N-acetyltransferase I
MSEAAKIRFAEESDRHQLAAMRALLWPESSFEEQIKELTATLPLNLVAEAEEGLLVGFLEVGLRSVADGCDTSRPVGYVEGWFVQAAHRGRGIGRALMRAADEWARSQGCVEMASDALIDNLDSQLAHEALGFEVVDRCVHYRRNLTQ